MISLRGEALVSTVSTKARRKARVPPVTRMTLPSRSRVVGVNRPKARSGTAANLVVPGPCDAGRVKRPLTITAPEWRHETPRLCSPARRGRRRAAGCARGRGKEEDRRTRLHPDQHPDRRHQQAGRPAWRADRGLRTKRHGPEASRADHGLASPAEGRLRPGRADLRRGPAARRGAERRLPCHGPAAPDRPGARPPRSPGADRGDRRELASSPGTGEVARIAKQEGRWG